MIADVLSSKSLHRLHPGLRYKRIVSTALCLLFLITLLNFFHITSLKPTTTGIRQDYSSIQPAQNISLPPVVPCIGARGKYLNESPDDQPTFELLEGDYPQPFTGSQHDLGVKPLWSTVEGRYGPYGYQDSASNRSQPDWNAVDWGDLQNQCFDRNRHRFPEGTPSVAFRHLVHRFDYIERSQVPLVRRPDQEKSTGRTALVIRGYDEHIYIQQEVLYLRALISEAALASGGKYQVFLLLHIKNKDHGCLKSRQAYENALKASGVPPEFWSMTILWDESLLENWYPDVTEHGTLFQGYQPMQLFAQHYPEFDHYWQLELDQHFLGHAGEYLDALDRFSRDEPRKQAMERNTYIYSPELYDSYENFTSFVNSENNGSSHIWGPMHTPKNLVPNPIGPKPPVSDPRDDNFEWGVGEDADAVMTRWCGDIVRKNYWFEFWFEPKKFKDETPRWWCAPAIQRSSRRILHLLHQEQVKRGDPFMLLTEANVVSMALWHGLKVSLPPHPVYLAGQADEKVKQDYWKGKPTEAEEGWEAEVKAEDGWGPADPMGEKHGLEVTTWGYSGSWPTKIMEAWFQGNEIQEEEELPWILTEVDGKVYIPTLMIHPVKFPQTP